MLPGGCVRYECSRLHGLRGVRSCWGKVLCYLVGVIQVWVQWAARAVCRCDGAVLLDESVMLQVWVSGRHGLRVGGDVAGVEEMVILPGGCKSFMGAVGCAGYVTGAVLL